MESLLDQVPDTAVFCEAVVANIADYLLFEREHFVKYDMAVFASSSVDLDGEQFDPALLEHMADEVAHSPLWLLVEHNPLIQPVGRVIAAKLFYAEASSTYFIAGVIGHYDQTAIPTFDDLGLDCVSFTEDTETPFVNSDPVQLAYSKNQIPPELVDGLLLTAPSLVSPTPEIRYYKSADPFSIFTVLSSLTLLSCNPYSKALLTKIGEKTGDEIISLWEWMKTEVVTRVAQLQKKTVLFIFESPANDCRVQFVISSKDPDAIHAAVDSIYQAARSADSLVRRMQRFEPLTLVYEFDVTMGKWLPLHATTRKHGVISNRPQLIALDRYAGMSVAGTFPKNRKAIAD